MGEHDVVAERRRRCRGYSSVDVECRVITHPNTTLQTFREQLRREVASESKLCEICCLNPIPKQPGQDERFGCRSWAERLVFMVQFSSPESQSWSKTRCEAIENSPRAQWTNIFGWEGMACSSNASEPVLPFKTAPPNATPKKRPAPATRNLDDIWNLEAVRKKTRRGKVYASVSDFCREMKTGNANREKKHLDAWMPKWADNNDWANNSWDNFNDFGSRSGGGLGGVGAIKSVCTDIYNICNKS